MNWARHERQELCDLFAALGPDAPTLDHGWTTRDLAAHLVIRERRPDAAIGILVHALAAHSEKVRLEVAGQPWGEVVELVRTGPPRWSPMALESVDRLTNTVEFFVHHEDVRRAQAGWTARPVDGDLEHELWQRLKSTAKILARRSPVGLVLRRSNGDEIVAKKAGDGPAVVVNGPASELLLFVSGRQRHANVDVTADADVTAQIVSASLGL